MRYKAFLLSLLIASPLAGKTTNETDSFRFLQIHRLQQQIDWVNPEAIRAYLDDMKPALGDQAPALFLKLKELDTLLPIVQQDLARDTTRQTIAEA